LRSRSDQVLAAFQAIKIPGVFATGSGCLGQCGSGPTVQVMPDGIWYCRVAPEQVSVIAEQHLRQNKPVKPLLHPRFHPYNSITDE
jgi:(2Fe-2S) ferredoxin